MADSKEHANHKNGTPNLLEEFIRLNPQLREVEGHPFCMNLYKLLTKKHRHQGQCEYGSRIFGRESCFMDHQEYWEDTATGLPVVIGHTYCPQHRTGEPRENSSGYDHRGELEAEAEKLAKTGLAYLASDGSWYHERAVLIVIARADVAAGVTLPKREDAGPNTQDMRERIPEIDWARILRDKLAEEATKRDELAQLALKEEEQGNYQTAFNFYCDTANIDREAGFNELAQEQLDQAKGLITAQPWLTINYDYFATQEDRAYICGPGLPTMPQEELGHRLEEIRIPDSWEDFTTPEWQAGRASANIRVADQMWGEATVTQGGNRNLWAATVTRYDDHQTISSIAGKEHGKVTGDVNHVFETIQEAIETAVNIWLRYDELSEKLEK